MEECDLLCLETGTTEDVTEVLKKFIKKVRYRKFVSEELIVSGYDMELVTRHPLVVQVLYLFYLSACSKTGHVCYI
jgi:hypothetical protein